MLTSSVCFGDKVSKQVLNLSLLYVCFQLLEVKQICAPYGIRALCKNIEISHVAIKAQPTNSATGMWYATSSKFLC